MKLKIEEKDGCKVLLVTEDVAVKDVEVLKAGTKRMFQMENLPIVLDLAHCTSGFVQLPDEIAALKQLAKAQGVTFVVAAGPTLQVIADSATLEEAIQKAKVTGSPEDLLKQLQARQDSLKKQRDSLQSRLDAATKSGDDPKALKRQSSDLKRVIEWLEKTIPLQNKDQRESKKDFSELETKQGEIRDTVRKIYDKDILSATAAPTKGASPK